MPWFAWLLLSLGGLLAVAALTVRTVRASQRGRRFLALPMRGKARFGRELLRSRGVPLIPKVALIVLVAYLAMPFDLIPDFIPVVGQLDDAFVAFLAILLLIAFVPRQEFEAALRLAEAEEEARRKREAVTVSPEKPARPSDNSAPTMLP